jgi:predicted ribosomally synthesized peptide with SipW-like signal peptide
MTINRAHSARTRRHRPSGRLRAFLTLGLVLGFVAMGSAAYWNDDATLSTGPISSGSLDLTLDGNLAGQGGTYVKSSFTVANMVPGESFASSVAVGNNGSVGLTYTATGTATGVLATGLTFQVYVGGTAANSGTAAAGNRAGTCGGTSTFGPATLTSTSQSVVSSARTLTAGSQESVCFLVRLPTSAANTLQGQTATSSFVFAAKQFGAP